jgi:hypothetical protein
MVSFFSSIHFSVESPGLMGDMKPYSTSPCPFRPFALEIAAAKIAKNNRDDTRELWLGILVWPGLFDLQNADGTEGNALLDRNLYLKETATGKKCSGLDAWPKQPERYT